jgi:hypothetical protein
MAVSSSGTVVRPETSPPVTSGHAWTRGEHQKTQEEVTDLEGSLDSDGDGRSPEFVGELWWVDEFNDAAVDFGIPGTNGEGIEIQR